MKIPFIDLSSQHRVIGAAVQRALRGTIRRGDFILGQDVTAFERSFADYLDVPHALGVNSGTDALFLGLLGLDVGPGDEVIVPAYTYIASAFAVTYTGAKPVFCDIDENTFTIDPHEAERLITRKTRALMPVHLYGQAADMDPILKCVKQHGLAIIEDAAQAHGCEYKGMKAGAVADIGAFSFYPTKNLGGFGDGGMVVTSNKDLFERLKKLRDYGRKTRYEHESVGYNSRLDSVQAAVLNVKLKMLDIWNRQRAEATQYYRRLLKDVPEIRLPQDAGYGRHVWHIFAIRLKDRDSVQEGLKKAGIATMVHYPVPLHLQKVYQGLGHKKGDFPVAERTCAEVLCLPIFPCIKDSQIRYVVRHLKRLVKHG